MKKNKILELHAEWLWSNGYKKESIDCTAQSKNDKREIVGGFKTKCYYLKQNGYNQKNIQILDRTTK
jgi:hypothetical protein